MMRLLLVDDHPLFGEGLARLLESKNDFQVVALCGTAKEGLEVLRSSEVDLVLLDYDLGDEHGNSFIRSARESGYRGKILFVTAGMNVQESSLALRLGASGILLKHSSPRMLVDAIRLVMEGEIWVDQKIIQQMAGELASSNRRGFPQGLTKREDQVIQGVLKGLANKEIAANLGVSEASIKSVLQQLFDKTGVRTRSQLVRIALESSLLRNKRH